MPFSSWDGSKTTSLQQLQRVLQLDESRRHPCNPALHSRCLEIMNSIDLHQLGLTETQLSRFTNNVCMDVYSCTDYCISVFVLPANSWLPLHDHPSMSVLSKVLCGKLQARAFTPLDNLKVRKESMAILSLDDEKGPTDPAWMLSESGLNINILLFTFNLLPFSCYFY